MKDDNAQANGEEPPSGHRPRLLKEFHSAGRGFWHDVPEADWNDWRWQLKHRVTTPDQLQRLMPTLTPEEFAGAKLATCEALGIDSKTLAKWLRLESALEHSQ